MRKRTAPPTEAGEIIELAEHKRAAFARRFTTKLLAVRERYANEPTLLHGHTLAATLEHLLALQALPDTTADEKSRTDEWVKRLHRASGPFAEMKPQTERWAMLLQTLARAAEREWYPARAANMPGREMRVLFTANDGEKAMLVRLTDEEAASLALEHLAIEWPYLATSIGVKALAEALPTWRARNENTGRRRKDRTIDGVLADLGRAAGLDPPGPGALRAMRSRLEKLENTR
jgi:hypothetical protein